MNYGLFIKALREALGQYDWGRVDTLVHEFGEVIRKRPNEIRLPEAKETLGELRRRRRFAAIRQFTEALPEDLAKSPGILRQRAQCLIEQGEFYAAEDVLNDILKGKGKDPGELVEAHGLLGRTFKQRYVKENAAGGPYRSTARELQRAVDEYSGPYLADKQNNFWHGINVVACLWRGERDGLDLRAPIKAGKAARKIEKLLLTRERTLEAEGKTLNAWERATLLEAMVARQLIESDQEFDFSRQVEKYLACAPDAFEIASTLRQFREVWQLPEEVGPGATIIPLFQDALLKLKLGGESVVLQSGLQLEKVFTPGQFLAIDSLRTLEKRSAGIARIERPDGTGWGTGWLVRGKDFFNLDGLFMLTNFHVVNQNGDGDALKPQNSLARLHGEKTLLKFEKEVVWSSPADQLDATFLRIQSELPKGRELPLQDEPFDKRDSRCVYVIGHPAAGPLSLSVNDNYFLDRSETRLHYRTPTQPGSSGSPVFEPNNWNAVGLHHAGSESERRLDGKGYYEANEGICLFALRKATRAAGLSRPRKSAR